MFLRSLVTRGVSSKQSGGKLVKRLSASSSLESGELDLLLRNVEKLAAARPSLARTLAEELQVFHHSRDDLASTTSTQKEPGGDSSRSTSSTGSSSSSGGAVAALFPTSPAAEEEGPTTSPVAEEERKLRTLKTMQKIASVRLQRAEGRGKTMLFAYLSDADKDRLLQLCVEIDLAKKGEDDSSSSTSNNKDASSKDALAGHALAARVAEAIARQEGRTALFAGLPGEVKYEALMQWRQMRDAEADASAKAQQLNKDSETSGSTPPAVKEYLKLALVNGAPMVGFGFADNCLMILFGEAIDASFGLYVSTMAAAGLGNLCSNIVGLGLADTIEHASDKYLGIPAPRLTPEQRTDAAGRAAGFAGTAVGVTVGCVMGLFPLLFKEDGTEEKLQRAQTRVLEKTRENA